MARNACWLWADDKNAVQMIGHHNVLVYFDLRKMGLNLTPTTHDALPNFVEHTFAVQNMAEKASASRCTDRDEVHSCSRVIILGQPDRTSHCGRLPCGAHVRGARHAVPLQLELDAGYFVDAANRFAETAAGRYYRRRSIILEA